MFEWLWQQMQPNTPTQTQIINQKIRRYASTGKPQEDFIQAEVTAWRKSPEFKFLLTTERYTQNEPKMRDRVRTVPDGRGGRKKSSILHNTKRCYPFFRDILDQRTRYLLAKPWTFQTEDSEQGKAYSEALEGYFTDNFRRRFKRLGRSAISDGLAWLQVGYDEKGNFTVTRVPRKEVIPFWSDVDHTRLDAVIRAYDMTLYLTDEQMQNMGRPAGKGRDIKITKIEFYTPEGVWYYTLDDTGLHEDTDGRPTYNQPHFRIGQTDEEGKIVMDDAGQPVMINAAWGRVPFIPFKSDSDETGLLQIIKSLEDDFDRMASEISNMLKDYPENVKVVRNYDGTNPEEFLEHLNTYRVAFVSGDGDVTNLTDPITTANYYTDLIDLRKNIYHFGGGIDYTVQALGNTTGVGLKFLYGKLDMFSADMADEFQASFEELLWFIDQDIMMHGGPDYTGQKVELKFNVDQIINETETIANVNASSALLSRKTVLAQHPWVKNVDEEIEQRDKEDEEAIKRQAAAFGYPEDLSGEDEDQDEPNPVRNKTKKQEEE